MRIRCAASGPARRASRSGASIAVKSAATATDARNGIAMPNCIVCDRPLDKTSKMFGQGTMEPERTWLPEYVCRNPDCAAAGSVQLVGTPHA